MSANVPFFPDRKATVFVERLEEEITLHELTVGYIEDITKNPDLDTPKNALISAGMTEEQVRAIGFGAMKELYRTVLELTYPDAAESPDVEAEDAKKNSVEQ